MKEKSKSAVSIIGGADGPTSIFIAGGTRKQPLKLRIQNSIYRYKRRAAEKKVVANAHTIDETVQYAMSNYNLIEIDSTDRQYMEQRKNLKESLILQHKPEALGDMEELPKPDSLMPMDFHLYRIRIGDDFLEMAIDYIWSVFGISYSGSKKVMKQFKRISRDLYNYYGVSEEDIKNRTERYLSLVTALSL